jgi:electron transfer flavoprotein alpha subunit
MQSRKSPAGENFLVVLEQRNGEVSPSSLEVWYKVLEIAAELDDVEVSGMLIGDADTSMLADLSGRTAVVFHAPWACLEMYEPDLYLDLVAELVQQLRITTVFMAGTAMGKDLAPRMSFRLKASAITDSMGLAVENGVLVSRRTIYSGSVLVSQRPCREMTVFTLRPHFFPFRKASTGHLHIIELPFQDVHKERLNPFVTEIISRKNRMDITEADVIVAGGRGMGSADNFAMLEQLASLLGGTVGASRSAVDEGWRPHSEQIGQTGRVVAPSLYIACGISGALQHLAGIGSAKTVVAINSDPYAPIFDAADFGIVGDVLEVVPALLQNIRDFLTSK